MKKLIFLILIGMTLFSSCKKETVEEDYIIDGNVENYNGKIYLIKEVATKYYFGNIKSDSALVINGKFEFKLSKELEFPLPFSLITESKIRTDRFILEPKNQKIVIDSLYYKTSPRIICENSTISEERDIFNDRTKPLFDKFKQEIDSIKNSDAPKESYMELFNIEREKLNHQFNFALVDFSKEYPESYFSFWRIVIGHTYKGYSKEIENAYNNLSPSIKNTEAAKIFKEDLIRTKSLTLGNYFPKINLKSTELEKLIFNVRDNSDSKYILIDFWFSHCSPCIRQFPKLKELYSNYPNQLSIVGIATDKTANINNWHKVIEEHEIYWTHLLDENGVESSKLSINIFPTNFLLNSEGIILEKNVSLVELERILKNL